MGNKKVISKKSFENPRFWWNQDSDVDPTTVEKLGSEAWFEGFQVYFCEIKTVPINKISKSPCSESFRWLKWLPNRWWFSQIIFVSGLVMNNLRFLSKWKNWPQECDINIRDHFLTKVVRFGWFLNNIEPNQPILTKSDQCGNALESFWTDRFSQIFSFWNQVTCSEIDFKPPKLVVF